VGFSIKSLKGLLGPFPRYSRKCPNFFKTPTIQFTISYFLLLDFFHTKLKKEPPKQQVNIIQELL
jgi:hypothetical protein